MIFDDLQQQWQQSNKSSTPRPIDADAMLRIWRRVEKSKSGVLRRDSIETIAAIFVICAFGGMIFTLESWVAKSGAIVCVSGALFIIYKLHHTRKIHGESRPELSLREYYQLETERVEKQIHLLRTIVSWYIAPLFFGANLVFAGTSSSWFAAIIYFVFTLLFCWGVYLLNQRAVAKHFVPLYEELKSLQKELEDAKMGDTGPNT